MQTTENIFAGFDEKMARVISNTAIGGLTPANLFMNLFQEKNEVSTYFKERIDLESLIIDFKELHNAQVQDKKYQKQLERLLSTVKADTNDRFATEISFMLILLRNTRNKKIATIFNNVIGKYLNPTHILEDFEKIANPVPNLMWDNKEDTILDVLGKDLTKAARDGDLHEIVDREEEIMRMIQILTRQTKSNPILVGEAGVGKTALVEKLAFILNSPIGIPSSLHGYKLYEVSIPAVVSSGDVEGAIQEIVNVTSKEKIILFMDEVHLIMEDKAKIANLLKPAMARGDIKLIGATTEDEFKVFEKDKAMTRRFQPVKVNAPDKTSVYRILKAKAKEAEEVHNVLIPEESLLKAIQLSERYIQHRNQPDKSIDLIEEASAKLRMILESKPEPLISILDKISDSEIEIEMIEVGSSEISSRDKEKIEKIKNDLQEKYLERDRLEEEYNNQKRLLDELISLKLVAEEFIKEQRDALHRGDFEKATTIEVESMPATVKSIQVAEQQLLDFAKTTDENLIQNVVTPNMIARIIEDQTGIPATSQDEDDLQKYRDMATTIKEQVHGQDKPIDEITAAIKRSKAGLADANKPLGSFMCLGPTGVGKTYLAQKIAEFMFDTDKVMHRFDMSEYMEAHSVARLFGSPPGYVGHDEGGQLTEAVKRNPYSIILFDEIEKAHPRVFDTLLQILDAGRMTDGQGNEVNFKNTIIIMTSNIGSNIIKIGLEKNHPVEVIEMALFEEVQKHFRPEFLNRFDAKVMFRSLSPNAVASITESELRKLADRLAEDNDIELHWHQDLAKAITNKAYDLNDGARPIKRYINDVIINMLTEEILNARIQKDSIVYVAPADEGSSEEVYMFQVTRAELEAIKDEEVNIVDVQTEIKGGSVVLEADIVDADIGQQDKKGKKKKKNKSKKNDFLSETFELKTETGD